MAEEEQSIPAVRQALTQITQHINAREDEVNRLTLAERHLSGRVEMLSERVRTSDQQLFANREEIRRLAQQVKDLTAESATHKEHAERGDDNLRRRVKDAEARAAFFEQKNDELAEQAELAKLLTEAGTKMVDAIERLPAKAEDITPMRSSSSDILLYTTYEWQAVSDARFLILSALGEKTDEMGG